MRHFLTSRINLIAISAGLCCSPSVSLASAFQLFEQDGASLGNYHAGYAAAAEDASTAFYNPAGLTRFDHQQLVVAADGVITSFKYQGNVGVNTVQSGTPQTVTAQGGTLGIIPAVHFVSPLGDRFAYGLSVDVPFGLRSYYGNSTILRYASTQTSVQVIDVSPSLAFKISPQWSIGAGPDLQIMKANFQQQAVVIIDQNYADGINNVDDTAYGYHAGVLYSPTEKTRYGLSYHSQVRHHLTGTSEFSGPLAILLIGQTLQSNTSRVNITLPPYTALSAYHELNSQYTLMGSIIYTQWSCLKNLTLQNVAGLENFVPSTNIVITVPQYFRNTYNLSVGLEDKVSEVVKLRAGLGFDQTPVRNAYRNVQLPDNNRYIIALGGHYQATKTIGFDASWNHIFMREATINPPPQQTGDEVITTDGSVKGGADVYGMQMTWDL
jgi:long-chain fatty acid transport protein